MFKSIRISLKVYCAFLIFASALCSSSQGVGKSGIFAIPADGNSVLRFFYEPNDSNYFHVALVLRVADEKDSKLDTAPVFDIGRTAFITLPEMQQLLEKLSHADLNWRESAKTGSLESYKTIHSNGGMNVKVLTSNSTAEATIKSERICDDLASLDASLKTPRALWEFQLFRLGFHCNVPNFNYHKYPDRVP